MAKFSKSEILMGRAKESDLTFEMQSNLDVLVYRLNQLFANYSKPVIVSSGYRPAHINKAVGGAKLSWHQQCAACDLKDTDGAVWQYVLDNIEQCEQLGLWLEDRRYTPSWVHLQIYPPKSGSRIFKPHAGKPLAPDAWDGKIK